MGLLEKLTTFTIAEATVMPTSADDYWEKVMDPYSDVYKAIRTIRQYEILDLNNRVRDRGEASEKGDRHRCVRDFGCCGDVEVFWDVTDVSDNGSFPKSYSLASTDHIMSCTNTLTATIDKIEGSENSCVFMISFCSLPLGWKYLLCCGAHRRACKKFFKMDIGDQLAYFNSRNASMKDDSNSHTPDDTTVPSRTTNSVSS